MDPSKFQYPPPFLPIDQIVKEVPGLIRVYKDGQFQKLKGTEIVPAGIDPSSGVQSKDVVISPETNLSARLYLPKTTNKNLPLLIYFHGGGFIIESASSPLYQTFLNLVATESSIVIVSVGYRTAPEHPVPTCLNDCWEAIKWVSGDCPDPWITDYADLENVYFGGDSAGATAAHHMAIRVGLENPRLSINLRGMILLHPYFWGEDRIGSEDEHPLKSYIGDVWKFSHPETSGLDDPLFNPDKDPNVSALGCSRVLVCVAEKDVLKDRGWYYKDILGKNGWKGDVEVIEDKGEDHVFFIFYPTTDIAGTLRKRICTFINHAKKTKLQIWSQWFADFCGSSPFCLKIVNYVLFMKSVCGFGPSEN